MQKTIKPACLQVLSLLFIVVLPPLALPALAMNSFLGAIQSTIPLEKTESRAYLQCLNNFLVETSRINTGQAKNAKEETTRPWPSTFRHITQTVSILPPGPYNIPNNFQQPSNDTNKSQQPYNPYKKTNKYQQSSNPYNKTNRYRPNPYKWTNILYNPPNTGRTYPSISEENTPYQWSRLGKK